MSSIVTSSVNTGLETEDKTSAVGDPEGEASRVGFEADWEDVSGLGED